MLSEKSPWKGIFTRRSSAEKPKPPKRGDPNASLRELALQQVLESCEDAAAEASLGDLREIASVIARWPPACLPWVLPRLGHRLLFACFFDSDLRSLVSAELLEAAIRRDEQRFRDASDTRLSSSSSGTKKYKGDPERAFAGYPLMDVFGDWGGLLGNVEPPSVRPEQLLFGHERSACVPDLGTPAFEPSLGEFVANLETFSSGLLRGLTWDGSIIAAGGAVLACALRSAVPPPGRRGAADPQAEHAREQRRWSYYEAREHHAFRRYVHPEGKPAVPPGAKSPFASSSDIDLFLVGVDPSAAYRKCFEVLRCIGRNLRGKVLIVTSGSALTFVTGWPQRNVQVVLKLFPSVAAVLASFDVDCCAFAYDGHQALCTARAMRAAVTRCNAIDLQRRSVTYESRLLKYAMRGFAIAVSPALLDRNLLDAASFDTGMLMFSSGHTGLRRLLVAEQYSISRRSAGPNKEPDAEGPPVEMREAWHGTNHWGRDFQKNKGFLPTLSTETTYHGSCERNLNLDEWFNLQESEAAHKGAQRAKGKDKPLYTQGLLPWRLGFDASRIEDYLVATRKSGERLRAYRSDEEGVATPAGGFTLSIGRHSTLPSEACTGWGYELGQLLQQSHFEQAASCGSFFPVAPEGFTSGCHMAGGAVPTSLFKLLFHKGAAQATPQANQLRTVGSIVEANNCKGRPGWHRCTVVSCEKVVHNPNVMVRFDDDKLVKTYTYRMRPLLPLQHAIRALVAVDLLPAELDNHCRLKQMKDAWLETRGLELRGALSEEQAERAQRVIDALASDAELREHGGDFTLSLLRYAPDVGRAAAVTAGEASPGGSGGALEAPAPMYDYRGVSVGSQVELHDLRSAAFNCQRGTVVGPMVEGRYPVEVVLSGAKKRIRIRLENLRSVNI